MNNYINANVKLQEIIAIIQKSFEIIKTSKKNIKFFKDDGSIITQADIDVDNYICSKLRDFDKDTLVISEEKKLEKNFFLNDTYWLIDPIDGTSNFSKQGNEFTVNIALIKNGFPEFGVIGHPPSKKIWYSFKKNSYLFANNKIIRLVSIKKNIRSPIIICSQGLDPTTKIFLKNNKLSNIKKLSSSLKFCSVAEGKADIYPRLDPISKWDIAAGDAIVRNTGGITLGINGKPINYKTPSSKTGKFIVFSAGYNKKSNIDKLNLQNI